jgi:hypothetical protein
MNNEETGEKGDDGGRWRREDMTQGRPRVTLKGVALVLCVVVLLLLNWAALDDITTGSERSLLSEWAVVFVTLAGVVAGVLFGLRKKRG